MLRQKRVEAEKAEARAASAAAGFLVVEDAEGGTVGADSLASAVGGGGLLPFEAKARSKVMRGRPL